MWDDVQVEAFIALESDLIADLQTTLVIGVGSRDKMHTLVIPSSCSMAQRTKTLMKRRILRKRTHVL
jgi:hypothetical protein